VRPRFEDVVIGVVLLVIAFAAYQLSVLYHSN
jgi:hypothetical protein